MREQPSDEDMVMGRCDPGLKLDRELQVGLEHTAQSLGSGDVPVLGTPALLALAEGACVQAIADDLPEGDTSVGTWAEIEHLRAAPTGATVCAHATLIGHHGRRLEFSVLVEQDGEVVAKVRHRRVLVDRERFLQKLAHHESPERGDRPAATQPPVDAPDAHVRPVAQTRSVS